MIMALTAAVGLAANQLMQKKMADIACIMCIHCVHEVIFKTIHDHIVDYELLISILYSHGARGTFPGITPIYTVVVTLK